MSRENLLCAALLSLIWVSSTSCQCLQNMSEPRGSEVPVDKVMEEVQIAIDELSKTQVPGLPPLKKVVVKLTTQQSEAVTGKVSLVVSASLREARSTGQVMKFTFKPEPSPERLIGSQLAESIVAAMASLDKANLEGLSLTEVSATGDLKISRDGSAGVSYQFSGVSFSGSGSTSSSSLHSIELVFAEATP